MAIFTKVLFVSLIEKTYWAILVESVKLIFVDVFGKVWTFSFFRILEILVWVCIFLFVKDDIKISGCCTSQSTTSFSNSISIFWYFLYFLASLSFIYGSIITYYILIILIIFEYCITLLTISYVFIEIFNLLYKKELILLSHIIQTYVVGIVTLFFSNYLFHCWFH